MPEPRAAGEAPRRLDVVVGRIGRPHGIQGLVGVEVRTDEPEQRLAVGAVLQLVRPEAARSTQPLLPSERSLTVASRRWHSGRLLLGFVEVADRDGVEGLRDALLVARVEAEARPEEPEEYYDRQLVGLVVEAADGTRVGEVVEVVHLPSQDLLAVSLTDGERRLVPFVEALVPVVDLTRGVVGLADVEGLLQDPPD